MVIITFLLITLTTAKECVPVTMDHSFYVNKERLFSMGSNRFMDYDQDLKIRQITRWSVVDYIKGVNSMMPCSQNTPVSEIICNSNVELSRFVNVRCLISDENGCTKVREVAECEWRIKSLIPVNENKLMGCGMFRSKLFCRIFERFGEKWIQAPSISAMLPVSFILPKPLADAQLGLLEYDHHHHRYYLLLQSTQSQTSTIVLELKQLEDESPTIQPFQHFNQSESRSNTHLIPRIQPEAAYETLSKSSHIGLELDPSPKVSILPRISFQDGNWIYIWQTKFEANGTTVPQIARLCRNARGRLIEDTAYRLYEVEFSTVDLKCFIGGNWTSSSLVGVFRDHEEIYTIENTANNISHICVYSMREIENAFMQKGRNSDRRKGGVAETSPQLKTSVEGKLAFRSTEAKVTTGQFTSIHVSKKEMDLSGNQFTIIYATSRDFQLVKWSNTEGHTEVLNVYSIACVPSYPDEEIISIKSDGHYLTLVSDSRASRMEHAMCKDHADCPHCLISQDPHCAYDLIQRKCIYVRSRDQEMLIQFANKSLLQDTTCGKIEHCPTEHLNPPISDDGNRSHDREKEKDWFIGVAAVSGLFVGVVLAFFGNLWCDRWKGNGKKGTETLTVSSVGSELDEKEGEGLSREAETKEN